MDKANGEKLLGVVDMVDIVTFVVRFAEECLTLPADNRNFAWFTKQLSQSGQNVSHIAGIITHPSVSVFCIVFLYFIYYFV